MQATDPTAQNLKDKYLSRRIGPYHAWNPISRTQIWQWCAAMGDTNPLYLGGEHAIAPPTMLQMWTFRDVRGKYAPGSTRQNVYEVLSRLDQLGFSSTVAVSYDQTYHSYLKEGDRVHSYSTIVAISDKKSTSLGEGYFVTEHAEYFNQQDELFGEAKITYCKYRPHEQPPVKAAVQAKKIERIRPVENHDSRHYWQGLRDGKLLIQRCNECQTYRHPPQPMCEKCQSTGWSAIASKGLGTIYSFTVIRYPEIPPFDYPNAIVLAELDEGVRLAAQLEGVEPEMINIGERIRAHIKEVQAGLSLPIFRLIDR